jgi:uncharacterized membrane protein
MDILDHHALTILIRWIHLAAVAVVFGGAASLCALLSRVQIPELREQWQVLSSASARYEWLFWLAAGVLVMTGVGNLGAFGVALPGIETAWGSKLMTKLIVVLAFLLLSSLRTILVLRLATRADQTMSARECILYQASYAGTVGLTAIIVLIAVGLAHG